MWKRGRREPGAFEQQLEREVGRVSGDGAANAPGWMLLLIVVAFVVGILGVILG